MPELPEVETIRLTLSPKLIGRRVIGVTISLAKLVDNIAEDQFLERIGESIIQRVERRGKYLLLALSCGNVLAIHLRMTGQLTVAPVTAAVNKATYFRLQLDDGSELRFSDVRKFGKVLLYPAGNIPAALKKLGPEPLEPGFTAEQFQRHLGQRRLGIKKALLNQEIIAGIGNIYADEALFLAGLHPGRPVNSLTKKEIANLHAAIRQVLTDAISYRGTTKRDYRDGEGNPGAYQNRLSVYGRKGEPCPACQTPIVKINYGGRGTHFCPSCQVMGENQRRGFAMKTIGLTGGIASGKSTVAKIFATHHIPVINADKLAHEAIQPGQPAYKEIVSTFGSVVLAENETIDRKKLGKIVFADDQAKKRLETIIHPVVIEKIKGFIATMHEYGVNVAVFEIPLLFEVGLTSLFDEIWVVTVDRESQLTRLQERDGLTVEEAKQRIETQLPLEIKVKKADVVIDNNLGVTETKNQVIAKLRDFGVIDCNDVT